MSSCNGSSPKMLQETNHAFFICTSLLLLFLWHILHIRLYISRSFKLILWLLLMGKVAGYDICFAQILYQTRQQDLTNFLRKVCEKVLSEPKVRQIGKVTDSSWKGGQLIVSQNQFLREKHVFTNQINDFCLE